MMLGGNSDEENILPCTLQLSKTSSDVSEPRMPNLSSFGDVVKPSMPCMPIKQQRNSQVWLHKYTQHSMAYSAKYWDTLSILVAIFRFTLTGQLPVNGMQQIFTGLILVQRQKRHSPSLWEMLRFHAVACLLLDLSLHRQSTHRQRDHSWSRTWIHWLCNDLLYRPVNSLCYLRKRNQCELHNTSINYCQQCHERNARKVKTI